MKYLVLGGEGFIGTPLTIFLSQKGHEVASLDFKNNPKQDLRDFQIKNLRNYDGCFFLAWDVGGSKYLSRTESWLSQYKNNIAIINNIFPQLQDSEVPFLFASSQLAGIDYSPYSLTKLLAEKYCSLLETAAIARQWNVYGPSEELNIKSHVISDMIHQAVEFNEIKLLTTGDEKRKFIHISDVCFAYEKLLTEHLGEIYDVSAGEYISIYEVAKYIADETGAKLVRGSQIGYTPVVDEIAALPGWRPQTLIQQGLTRMIKNFTKNRNMNPED
jgi:nucleoside-diphosphate-sugar epimerase